MKNIILIGMPAVGKSTIGVLLAKTMLMDFSDTDLLIQQKMKKSLCEIIEEKGNKEFLSIENGIICDSVFCNCVVATGGSAVYSDNAMRHLAENGIIIYLKASLEEITSRINSIKTRGVVAGEGMTLTELFEERRTLYEKYADITANCGGLSPEDCVRVIVDKITALQA